MPSDASNEIGRKKAISNLRNVASVLPGPKSFLPLHAQKNMITANTYIIFTVSWAPFSPHKYLLEVGTLYSFYR